MTALTLAQVPIVDLLAQEAALNFVNNTLPNLVAGDPRLMEHLGFTSSHDLETFGVMLEPPLPFFIIDIEDLRKFVQGQTQPLDLLFTDINWTRTSAGTFGPARFLFPIKLQNNPDTNEGTLRSSVIIEKTPTTSWRVPQAGAPTLIRAVKTYSTRPQDFVVWIPSINRHYLGRMNEQLRFTMTVLFDDKFADVEAGHEFDPGDSKVVEKLRKLDKKLQKMLGGKQPDRVDANP